MARYAVGDVQGCFYTFKALLKKISFNPKHDQLYLVGDIINRGKNSCLMLQWCYQHQANIHIVLGNHDLHAIAVAHGLKSAHRSDTLQQILLHTECHTWLNWLRQQPLIYQEADFVMVHAGLLPQWSIEKAMALGQEATQALNGENYIDILKQMYGNQPNAWHDALDGIDRLRVIINAFTRMRICDTQGAMEMHFKGELADVPEGYYPWFKVPERTPNHIPIVFGHWSALGLHLDDGVIALDTGCLWGRQLTAYCFETQQITQITLDKQDVA